MPDGLGLGYYRFALAVFSTENLFEDVNPLSFLTLIHTVRSMLSDLTRIQGEDKGWQAR